MTLEQLGRDAAMTTDGRDLQFAEDCMIEDLMWEGHRPEALVVAELAFWDVVKEQGWTLSNDAAYTDATSSAYHDRCSGVDTDDQDRNAFESEKIANVRNEF